MKPHEVEWLCKHLGHTADIHKIHYRNTSSYIERVNLGKLFLIQDNNACAKFAGKDLSAVNIEGLYYLICICIKTSNYKFWQIISSLQG